MPEIACGCRLNELDACCPFSILGSLKVHNAALLLFPRVPVDQPENLSDRYTGCHYHQPAMSADAVHLREFAEKLSFTFKSDDIDRHGQPQPFASAAGSDLSWCGNRGAHEALQ